MMRSRSKFGLAQACVRKGFPYRSGTVTGGVGRFRDEFPCTRLAEPHLPVAAGLHSEVLTGTLIEAARRLGVRLHFSADVDNVTSDDDRAALHVGARAPVIAYITLLATGGEPSCRGMLFEPERSAEVVTWWHGQVQRSQGLDQPQLVLVGLRSKLWMAQFSGTAAGVSLIGDDLQAHDGPTLSSTQVRAWLRMHGCHADLVSLMSNDADLLRPMRARTGVRPLPWHRGNLLCLGAQAHGLPPHFSQPLGDAVVLGELLDEPNRAQPNMPELLQRFVQRRQPRVRAVFDVAARAMQWGRDPKHSIGLKELAASMAAVVAAPA